MYYSSRPLVSLLNNAIDWWITFADLLFFSQVFRARSRTTGEVVALKHVCYGEDGQRPLHVVREIEGLQALQNHPHILQLLGFIEAPFSISLVLQYCERDLYSALAKAAGASPPLAVTKAIYQQLLQSIDAVHSAGLAHRDISPGNILFDTIGSLRLSDFGQARRILSPNNTDTNLDPNHLPPPSLSPSLALTPAVGTRWYRAPELLFGSRKYSTSIDIWSAGCIFAELLSGRPLFPGGSDIDQLCQIRDVLGSPSIEAWDGFADLPDWGKLIFPPQEAKSWEDIMPGVNPAALRLLGSMLCYDPTARLTAKELLNDGFFTEAPGPAQPQEVMEELKTMRSRTNTKS